MPKLRLSSRVRNPSIFIMGVGIVITMIVQAVFTFYTPTADFTRGLDHTADAVTIIGFPLVYYSLWAAMRDERQREADRMHAIFERVNETTLALREAMTATVESDEDSSSEDSP